MVTSQNFTVFLYHHAVTQIMWSIKYPQEFHSKLWISRGIEVTLCCADLFCALLCFVYVVTQWSSKSETIPFKIIQSQMCKQWLVCISHLWSGHRRRITLVASIWSCSESMNRSPTGSQASLTPSAWSRAAASSSMAAWICNSLSRVRSMCRCRSTQRAVNFSHRSLATLACFHTERLTFSIRRRGESSVMERRGRMEINREKWANREKTTALISLLLIPPYDTDTLMMTCGCRIGLMTYMRGGSFSSRIVMHLCWVNVGFPEELSANS